VTPASSTRVFAILGDPVTRSLSPVFQNAALAAAGLDGVYVALRCGAGELPGLLRGIAAAGGGGNVTAPHKQLAARSVDRRTPECERTGACNTYWSRDGEVWGDNTDVAGCRAAIHSLVGSTPTPRVLLIGAGGVARALLCALPGRVEHVAILNRTPARAAELAERFASDALRIEVAADEAELGGRDFDLVVHASSLGLRPGDPLPPTDSFGARFALDLVYSPTAETPWVRRMRELGVSAADGTEVLLEQGVAAFRRWWDVEPPVEAMRAALTPAR